MDTNNIIDIIEVSRYRDGGTSVWLSVKDKYEIKTIEDANDCKKYYIDNRISSTTKGELYDRYPSDEGAMILDKSNYNFVTKEQIERDKKIDEICHYSGLPNVLRMVFMMKTVVGIVVNHKKENRFKYSW